VGGSVGVELEVRNREEEEGDVEEEEEREEGEGRLKSADKADEGEDEPSNEEESDGVVGLGGGGVISEKAEVTGFDQRPGDPETTVRGQSSSTKSVWTGLAGAIHHTKLGVSLPTAISHIPAHS
jgi:hypothetical protein